MDLSPAADRTDMSDKASELSDTESSDMSYLVDDADLYRAGREETPDIKPCFGRCRCISKSAKTLRSVSKLTDSFYNSRAGDAIHQSHTEPGITELNLCVRHLGSESMLPVTACLQSQPLISVLDLSYNSLEEEGGVDLMLALVTNRYVTDLNVSGNRFGKTKVAAYVMILLSHNNILRDMKLCCNSLDDKDVYFIAGGIMENNYLVSLDLSSNSIEERGAGYLGRAVAINNSLETLDLSQNKIRRDGAILIGKSVMFNSNLVEINLSGNGLAYHGALAVRQCLQKNTKLKKIDISSNRINWEGAIVLAHGLEVNETLEVLIAGDNPLTTTGCMDLIDAVSSSCTLKTLDLKNVNIVRDFKQAVRMIQEVNKDFQAVYGLVLNSHDILGLRRKRAVHPMVKILNYMFEKELRPVELLRSMDKTVSFKLTREEFLRRCVSMGIDIKSYERAELMEYILSDSEGVSATTLSYKVLLASIERFIDQERLYRLGQRHKAQSLTKYQRYLLARNLPQVSVSAEVNTITEGLLDKLHDCDDKHEIVSGRIKNSVTKLHNKKQMSAFRERAHKI